MMRIIGGLIVFGLYILYDVNSVRWQKKGLHASFFFGSGLLAGLTVMQIAEAIPAVQRNLRFWVFLVLAVAAFLLLADTLFFELPFEETYLKQDGKPQVYDGGMYALCRHPGVLWFFLMYLFLGMALWPSKLLFTGLFYSFLNLVYVIFQDVWTFPQTFSDYGRYRETTPFLLPTPESVKRALRTGKWTGKKEQ